MSKYKKFTYSICKHDGKYKSHGKISDENCRKKCDSNEGLKKKNVLLMLLKNMIGVQLIQSVKKKS